MTKLQSIEAEFQTLPAEEQREFISRYIHLAEPNEGDFFELTEVELAELDRRIKNIDNEPTFTSEEVFARLRKEYAQSDLA
jgi:hypothetical protein